ncbi:40831_t:CDS:2 [Gigaspora margarita]|uniref:40831_t:CDS:1 n=1 Tax=Gigaspora margarita TaxID=4874 RepID=A0ABN7W093_GIGMA|nr:40831_t:CDS:2 [Gigaspora margarita]
MESFQVTAPFLRTINQLQRFIRGSHVATLLVMDAKIECSFKESRIPLFHEDLQRIGYPAIEFEKVEGEDWGQQMDYLCIRIQLCRLNQVMPLQYYYLLGKRLVMYNWNAYAKHEMMDRFAANKFKGA